MLFLNQIVFILLFLSMVLPTSISHAKGCKEKKISAGTNTYCMNIDNKEREYVLTVPKLNKKLPVVFSFHGRKGHPKQHAKMTGFRELAASEGFILVEPRGYKKSWNAGECCSKAKEHNINDLMFVKQILKSLKKGSLINPKRVYATGFSNGSRMTHLIACKLADQFAAVAPVGGQMAIKPKECKPSRAISVFMLHGMKDHCNPYNGGFGSAKDIDNPKVTDLAHDWALRNSCNKKPMSKTFRKKDEKYQISKYGKCKNHTEVVLYSFFEAGHVWPGGSPYLFWRVCRGAWPKKFNTSLKIWNFFKNKKR